MDIDDDHVQIAFARPAELTYSATVETRHLRITITKSDQGVSANAGLANAAVRAAPAVSVVWFGAGAFPAAG